MNDIMIFNNPEFGVVRTAGTAESPLFCLTDVCKALNLRAPDVTRRLEDDVVSTHTVEDSRGRKNNLNFINEDGLYDVILDSRKKSAKAFRKWVTSEVLPSIRKTGGYIATNEKMTDEEIMARALNIAQDTIRRRDERIRQLEGENNEKSVLLEHHEEVIEEQRRQLQQSAPMVDYYKETLQSVNTMTTTQIAYELGYTAAVLNAKLRDIGVQMYQSGQWLLRMPYARWNLTGVRTTTFTRSDGSTGSRSSTVWNERGRMFIHALHKFGFDKKLALAYITGEQNESITA